MFCPWLVRVVNPEGFILKKLQTRLPTILYKLPNTLYKTVFQMLCLVIYVSARDRQDFAKQAHRYGFFCVEFYQHLCVDH